MSKILKKLSLSKVFRSFLLFEWKSALSKKDAYLLIKIVPKYQPTQNTLTNLILFALKAYVPNRPNPVHSSIPMAAITSTSSNHRKESPVGYLVQISPTNTIQRAKLTKNTDTNSVFKKLSHPSHTMNLDITVFEDYIPPFTCVLENNYTIGCDSDSIYVFNEQLRLVRLISLLEALETTRTHSKKSKQNVNLKLNLNLNVNAIYYEIPAKKLYLFITVQNQHCFMNIFDLEMISTPAAEPKQPQSTSNNTMAKNTDTATVSGSDSLTLPKLAVVSGGKFEFSLFLDKKYHMGCVKPNAVRSMVCSDQYLFMNEQDNSTRVFLKETGNFVARLDDRQIR